eukprot:8820293-Heterocapsa_arctica.AAC.1
MAPEPSTRRAELSRPMGSSPPPTGEEEGMGSCSTSPTKRAGPTERSTEEGPRAARKARHPTSAAPKNLEVAP